MSDVFVSYSREDRDVVRPIVEAMRAAGENVWVDLDDIVPSAVWMDEIKNAIAAADSMVFFLTPDSADSDVCRIELGHALELSKRIVPVVIRDVQTETVPPPLPDINWHFIRPETLDADVAKLVEVLNTDIARVHMHTRLLVRANEWMVRNENASLLLRGVQLDEAEQWLAGQGDQKPTTTPDQGRFIAASRRAASRRQRISVTAAIAITAVMALVATIAVFQWHNATVQRREATEQRNAAVSREFAAYSRDTLTADPQLALILALRAYDSSPTPAAQVAVRDAVRQSSVRAILPADLTPRSLRAAGDPMEFGHQGTEKLGALGGGRGFDRSGNHVLAFGDQSLVVWKWTERGERPDVVTLPIGENLGRIGSAEFGGDGHVVFTVDRGSTTTVFDWDVARGPSTRPIMKLEMSEDSTGGLIGLSPGGTWALGPNRPRDGLFTLESLENPDEPPQTIDLGSSASFSGFSPDGSLFAIKRPEDVVVYRTADMSALTSYPISRQSLSDMAFRPDNRVLAIAGSAEIDLVDLTTPGGPTRTRTLRITTPPGLPSANQGIKHLAWSPNGYALAVGTSGTSIRVFAGDTDEPAYLNGDTNAMGGLSFSDDGRYLLSTGLQVEVWDWAATLTSTYFANGQPSPPVFSPDGDTVAAGGTDGNVAVYDTHKSGSRKLGVGIPLAFSSDGNLLAVEEAAAVSVWDVASSAKLTSLPLANPNYVVGKTHPFLVARFDDAGDVLAVMRRWPHPGQAWRWPSRSGEPATTLSDFGGDQGVKAILGWESDGHIDLIAESSMYEWDGSRPPKSVATADANFWDIGRATFLTPTEVLLNYEESTRRWDTQSGSVTQVLPNHESSGFAVSGDRRIMAIAGWDGFVNMWDFEAESPVYIGRYGAAPYMPHIGLNNDGSMLAVADGKGIHLEQTAFAGRINDVIARARSLVVRPLTTDEAERYLPS